MPFRVKRWRILSSGDVDPHAPDSRDIAYECPHCGRCALLPVQGRVIAQTGDGGFVFDGRGCLPPEIQCRGCRRRFTTTAED